MVCKRKYNKRGLQLKVTAVMLFMFLQLAGYNLFAQEEKVATIQLSFTRTDTTKTCIATVMSDSLPVKGTEVHLYAKSLYGLLPVDKVFETDENGKAEFNFPMDLPGHANNMITVIAKIERDENYGNVETQSEVQWGVAAKNESYNWSSRSFSASREKAPMFLIIVSVSVILGIWGAIVYLIFQLFRIKKSGRAVKKLNSTQP